MRWPPQQERIDSLITKDPVSTCWIWQGSIGKDGYGKYANTSAHRAIYEILVGPIPEGLHLDHLAEFCINLHCVKAVADENGPAHLEPGRNSRTCAAATRATPTARAAMSSPRRTPTSGRPATATAGHASGTERVGMPNGSGRHERRPRPPSA